MTVSEPDTWTWPDAYDCPEPPTPGWMQSLCVGISVESLGWRHPWRCYVQKIQLAGRQWSYATDSKGILFVDDNAAEHGHCLKTYPIGSQRFSQSSVGSERFVNEKSDIARRTKDMLLTEIIEPFECDIRDLLLFLGDYKHEPCPVCNQESREDRGCEDCTDGFLWPEVETVRIVAKNRWFERNLLAQYLTPLAWLGVTRVRCGFAFKNMPHPEMNPLVVESADEGERPSRFRAVVMGMKDDYGNPMHGLKRSSGSYPRYIPGIGALWHLRNGFEEPLRDWVQEQGENPWEILGYPF